MLPAGAKERKEYPVGTGVLDYFPDAITEVAHVSFVGNQQHNPGQKLHWNRALSTDEADALIRHFLQRGTMDTDGVRHSAKVAWRALALLQKEIEAESVPDATGNSHELDRPLVAPNRSSDVVENATPRHSELPSYPGVSQATRALVPETRKAKGDNWNDGFECRFPYKPKPDTTWSK